MTAASNLRKETEKITRSILQATPNGLLVGEFEKEYRGMIGSPFPYRHLGAVTCLDLLKSMNEVVEIEPLTTGHLLLRAIPDSSTEHITRMSAAQKPNEVGYNRKTSQMVREQDHFPDMEALKVELPDRVGTKMKDDLRRVLDNHPSGLAASQLSREYSKEHGLSLDYKHYGCVSVVEFCRYFPDLFAVIHGGLDSSVKDWVLYNASSVKSDHPQNIQFTQETEDDNASLPPTQITSQTRLKTEGTLLEDRSDCDSQIDRGNSFRASDSTSIWKNVVGPRDTILQQQLPSDLDIGSLLEVIVTKVVSPNDFSVQLKDKTKELESLMKEMEDFYYGDSAGDYKIPDSYVVVGSFCASVSTDGLWYRGLVTSMKDLSTVEVLQIDYGHVVLVKKESLLYIHKKFASFPSQNFHAWLADIKPPEGLRRYPKESSERFRHLALASPVGHYAVYRGGREKLCLLLIDTYTNDLPQGKEINRLLVEEGLAELNTPPVHQASVAASTDENKNLNPPGLATNKLLEDIQRELDEGDGLAEGSRITPGGKKDVDVGERREESFRCVLLGGKPCYVVNKQGKVWMDSRQISRFIPRWRQKDILNSMLTLNNMSVESLVVTETSDSTLYSRIKAALGDTGGHDIVLYPLKSVPLIIKLFRK